MNVASRRHPIAAIQEGSSRQIQALLAEVVERRSPALRIAGVIEAQASDHQARRKGRELRVLADSSRYPLFQNLGAGSSSCSLDPQSLANACERVRATIARGCDLVVISKFGKLEAENRSGLLSAFAAAIEAGAPILTSVSPAHMQQWERFAAPLFEVLPPDIDCLLDWCDAVVTCQERAR